MTNEAFFNSLIAAGFHINIDYSSTITITIDSKKIVVDEYKNIIPAIKSYIRSNYSIDK